MNDFSILTTSETLNSLYVVIGLALYLYICDCSKLICEKCGLYPGILIWMPIINLLPLLKVAKMPDWTIVLFFVPLANVIVGAILCLKICEARGKSGWL